MTPDFFLCDVCNKRCGEDHRICVLYDRSVDAAGSMDDDSKNVDLCGTCAIKAIKSLFLRSENNARADFKQGRRFLDYIQQQTKKQKGVSHGS